MNSPATWLNGGPRLDGVRVLVVEDAPYVRAAVSDILMQDGAKVTAVGSSEEAFAALQSERPDVLLSDLSMPGKGGYWLIRQVGHSHPSSAAARPLPRSLPTPARIPRKRPARGVPAPRREARRSRGS